MSDERPMAIGTISGERGKSKRGTKHVYAHRMMMRRGHMNLRMRDPVSSHAPNATVILHTRMIETESTSPMGVSW